MDVAPPKFPHPSSCDRLRRVLAAADYSERGVVETLGGEQIHGLSSQDLPVLLWRTRGATPRTPWSGCYWWARRSNRRCWSRPSPP